MMDVIYIAIGLLFFLLTYALLRGCDALQEESKGELK